MSLVLRCSLVVFLCFSMQWSHAAVDTVVGCKVPKSQTRTVGRLAAYLCDSLSTDREKANAIYNWITHNIRYNVKSALSTSLKHDDNVIKVLRTRKAVCEGYSYLFAALCNAAGLQAVTVEGYARDWIFDDGDKLYVPRHLWNAVLINGEWQLVDATWGAGGMSQAPGWLRQQLNKVSKNPVRTGKLRFVANYDTSYFLQQPEEFRLTHIPTDPIWQLTDTAMPLTVFEAGKTAVASFNEISKPAQQKDLLGAAADYNEIIRTYEYADRAFNYNPRFYGPLAMREMVDAEVQIRFGDSINKYDPMPARYRYGKATRALGMTREYLKKQQDGYNQELRDLKQKNQRKYDSAKRYVREIKADNKKLIAQCEQKLNTTRSRQHQIAGKLSTAQKMADDKAIQPSRKSPGTLNPALLREALDSVAARNAQLARLQTDLNMVNGRIKATLDGRDQQLEQLGTALQTADSLIVNETIAHIKMYDVCDEEVIRNNQGFREAKFRNADTLQARYQRNYDALLSYFDERSKLELARLNIYKSSLRSLAKYQQNGGSEPRAKYAQLRGAFDGELGAYNDHLQEYRRTTAEYAGVFRILQRLYERQNKIAAYMEQAEEKRKTLESNTLEHKAELNKKENTSQKAYIEKALKRARRLAGPEARKAQV